MAAVLAIEAELAAKAAKDALTIAEPIAIKFGDVFAKSQNVFNKLFKPSIIENQFNKIENSAEEQIVKNTEEQISHAKTSEEIKAAIVEGKLEIEKMQTAGQRYIDQRYIGQRGGKKILSRTNKSIAQFLNSKITFQSILKRMTSKYKKGKALKQRTKRRLHKR
jgi:hypothetical protein